MKAGLREITKGIRMSVAEEALFKAAAKRDGIPQLGTWVKSVCTRYAEGRLIPAPPKPGELPPD